MRLRRITFKLDEKQKTIIDNKAVLLGFKSVSDYCRYALINYEDSERRMQRILLAIEELINEMRIKK